MEKYQITDADREEVKGFSLADDEAFSIAFRDNCEAATYMVRTILSRSDISVESVQTQEDVLSTEGRSFRLDMFLRCEDGTLINIEMERTRTRGKALERRMRAYLGALSVRSLEKGEPFGESPDVAVIFITDDDPYGKGRSVYSFTLRDSDGEEMKDAGVLLAVANSRYRDTIETEISRFYRDLFETDIEAVKNPLLRESLRKVKGDDAMIEATVSCIRENGIKAGYRMGMEDGRIKGRDEGRVEGLSEGRSSEKADIARKLLLRNMASDEIASITGLSAERIEEIAETL